ncbi:hypothetical protein ACXIVC_21910 [Vibrio parahaemolyticus]|nr:hypothetical protein [Vibrio alginolyticus]
MKTIAALFIRALPSLLEYFKGMTPKERVIVTVAAAFAALVFTLLVHFFGYETVSGAIDLFGEAMDEVD